MAAAGEGGEHEPDDLRLADDDRLDVLDEPLGDSGAGRDRAGLRLPRLGSRRAQRLRPEPRVGGLRVASHRWRIVVTR